jgi:hypothetical protein
MPMNGFTVGRDVTIQIVGQNNAVVATFATLTGFSKKQNTVKIASKGMDGVIRYLELPDGWEGHIMVDRSTSAVDDYFAQLESNYYAGVTIGAAQITETITEVSGAQTQYRYVGVMLKLDDAGESNGENLVKQKMTWCASKRLKIQ